MSTIPPPPRLTVLAASEADVAVVVRRGPTDWARLSLWDTARDVVEHGGWIHARVDARRCDLSPDGRLFVAFVARDRPVPGDDGTSDWRHATWVAISRPPWWRALALWWNGTTWDFGGFFPDRSSCTIGPSVPDLGTVPRWFDTDAPVPYPHPDGWTTRTVPHNRRHRDGWTETGPRWWERPVAGGGTAVLHVPDRETLASELHTGAEAALRWDDELLPLGDDASLDVDRRGRALVARRGRLEVHHGPADVEVVADLRDQRPDPRPAPSWAETWPDPTVG